MSITRHIHLDPLGGVAGDMFVAAMLDAFPDLHHLMRRDIEDAGLLEHVFVDWEEVRVNGIMAGQFSVLLRSSAPKPTSHYSNIRQMLESSQLARPVLACCIAIFDMLAAAEGKIHGIAPEAVHFHELADWDSLVDITAAASLITHVDAASWSVSPLPAGSGTVLTAHGVLPVPAPATLELLKGFVLSMHDGVPGERITPTGAAILRYLTNGESRAMPGGNLTHIGAGAGTKRFEEFPNILRLFALEKKEERLGEDRIAQISFEIDDMTPELLAIGLDKLRDCAGVCDVSYGIRYGKKGRILFAVHVLVTPEYANFVATQCLLETSTLGLRISVSNRIILERESEYLDVLPAKRATRPDGEITTKLEADSLRHVQGHRARERTAAQAILKIGSENDGK